LNCPGSIFIKDFAVDDGGHDPDLESIVVGHDHYVKDKNFLFRATRRSLPLSSDSAPAFTRRGYRRLRIDVKNKGMAAEEAVRHRAVELPLPG